MRRTNAHSGKTRKNVMQIGISLSQMVAQSNKKYKTVKLNEIISVICGLLNSGGGQLELFHLDDNRSKRDVDACIRMIEQRIVEIVGTVNLASKIRIAMNPEEISIFVQESSTLITVNYNLYLPSRSQVIAVPATEPLEKVKKIMQRKVVEDVVPIGSHTRKFVKGKHLVVVESSNVGTKQIKADSSKCITLADRIVGKSNKFTCYISAFANHGGGHVYYGINDSGIVEGETVSQKDKDEIVKKVNKTIIKMIWPLRSDKPKQGVQWDIFFEPVVDDDSNPIPSTFVIILYVAPCLGGVFTEEPESYCVTDGQIQRISFREWSIITGIHRSDDQASSLPPSVSRVTWSSEKNRKIHRMLGYQLIRYRNDHDMDSFNKLSKLAQQSYPGSNVELIVTAEKIVVRRRSYDFCMAKSLLGKFEKMLQSSKDSCIFEVKMLELKSVLERTSTGNYEASFAIAEQGLQKMEGTPIELQTVWLYMEAAMIATLISANKADQRDICSFKTKALQYITLATSAANLLEDQPFKMSDVQQKLRIYKAWILLGCCITGDVVLQFTPTHEDIEAAAGELSSVYISVLNGSFLTHFRKVQYHLAECDLFRRRSEVFEQDYIANLKQAVECASKARALTRKYHFENMVNYANKRLADLTERLVRHAVDARGRRISRTFLNLEY